VKCILYFPIIQTKPQAKTPQIYKTKQHQTTQKRTPIKEKRKRKQDLNPRRRSKPEVTFPNSLRFSVLGAPSTPPPAPNPSISTIKTKEEETPDRETPRKIEDLQRK